MAGGAQAKMSTWFSKPYDHFLRNAHILQTSMWYMGSQKVVVIRGTELDRQQKTPSCTMELKSNFSLNQAWL